MMSQRGHDAASEMGGHHTMSKKITIVSGDGHVGPGIMEYLPYFDQPHRDTVGELLAQEAKAFGAISPGGAITTRPDASAMGTMMGLPTTPDTEDAEGFFGSRRFGAWDLQLRLKELDNEGVTAEVLVPGHQFATPPLFSVQNQAHEAELRQAGVRAYHRWLAEFMADSDGRLYGQADPGSCHDMDETVKELHWAAAHGFVGVGVPGIIEDETLPPLYDTFYEPFWAACSELDITLLIHAGWGFPQGRFQDFGAKFHMTMHGPERAAALMSARAQMTDDEARQLADEMANSPESPLRLDFGPRRLVWQLMLAGVFDRYPNLRLVLTEVRADWVPATLTLLDSWYDEGDRPLKMKPSEYWHRNCFVTPSSIHRAEVELRDQIGVDRLMFGMDYPHPEGTWPNTWDWFRAAFDGVPEADVRKIVGQNAIACFNLDEARLDAIAERIGPRPEDIVGSHHVDATLIESFHTRAGFNKPAPNVDMDAVRELLVEDERAVSQR
ncbi:MAG: hypothetical protein JWN99_2981 [Ilumatobacteraceae bacterium]|nr:hypothetical protein [Ilumatobacteraceae bacterium]